MLIALNGGQPDVVPVAPEWWGYYKFEIAGLDPFRDGWRDGAGMVPIYEQFYQRFKPDWFELHDGTPAWYRHCQVVKTGEKLYLVGPGFRAEIRADESLYTETGDRLSHAGKETMAVDLGSKRSIDEYLTRGAEWTAEYITQAGYTDHVREIVSRYGDEALVAVDQGLPGLFPGPRDGHGYVEGLMALYDYADNVKYMIERRYAQHLEWAKAFAAAGLHAYIACEDMAGADTISPRMYEEFLFPVHKWYFTEVKKMGMIPIVYYCGNVVPLLDYLKETDVQGLAIEESRKGFRLDVVEVAKRLEGKICLMGNVDTVEVLWRGTVQDVEVAVQYQLQAAEKGGFIMRNGSPLALGTPPANVEALIQATRYYGRYPIG